MNQAVLQWVGYMIYTAMAVVAVFGAFYVILLARRITQKRFFSRSAADQFLDDIREKLSRHSYEEIAELCDSPPYWSKAVPQLILVAMQNRNLAQNKLRRLLSEKFERDILASLEYGTSWISTIVKSAPMLGLLGTVIGMIGAFEKIADSQNPSELAGQISFALLTTALGLTIAIPLVLAGNMIHVRIGKLQDSVQENLGMFLEDLDTVTAQERGRSA